MNTTHWFIRAQCAMVAAKLKPQIGPLYIAGGVARDVLFDKPVKDIDVFVGGDKYKTFDPQDVANILGGVAVGVTTTNEEYVGTRDLVDQFVIEFEDDRLPVNVITLGRELRTVDDVIKDSFDIDLCEAYFNTTTSMMHASGDANRAFYNRRMTIKPRKNEKEATRSLNRCHRLLAKYEGFAIRDNSGFDIHLSDTDLEV